MTTRVSIPSSLLLALAVCSDMILWGLTSSPMGFVTKALAFTLMSAHAPLFLIGITSFFALWFQFVLTGTFGLDLLVLMPLGAGYYYSSWMADVPRPVLGLVIGLGLVAQSAVFNLSLDPQGIFWAFLSGFGMVYLVAGSQGNRLH